MKKVISTLFLGAMAYSASAQFTLIYSNAPSVINSAVKDDTISVINLQGGGIPNLNPGANVFWDLSNVQYKLETTKIFYDTLMTPFMTTNAEYNANNTYYFTQFMPYTSNAKFGVNPNGIFTYGEHLDQQVYPLMGPNDSLVIVNQDIVYSDSVRNVKYPLAAGNASWTSSMNYNINMLLTIQSEGLTQAPIKRVSYVVRVDSAVGYGKIKAKRLDNIIGQAVDVIQIRTTMTTMDSFLFQNNVPLDSTMLASFGLSQGQVSMVYQYAWYRNGEVTPMMSAVYEDAGFSVLHDLNLHRQRVLDGTNVNTVSKNNNISIYPNPAKGEFTIAATNVKGAITYELMNITGQVVAGNTVIPVSGEAVVSTGNVAAGTYFVRVINNNEVIGVMPLTIQ